jgi:polyhydroxybutyrate depolymerase
VVTVYPDGLVLGWNDGRTSPDLQRLRGGADDLSFLRALVESLIADGVADPGRIVVTGSSNGGMMALRLACDMADRLAAIAVVTAPLSAEQAQSCRPARPLSILVMNCTADATFPYEGGRTAGPPGQDFGRVLSAEATAERWRSWNGCRGEPERYVLPDRDPGDGTRIHLQASRGCAGDTEVLLYTVQGGGHTLPGHGGGGRAGLSSRDADGAALIWAFLRRHQH